jgi:hypothetical protein
LKTKIFHYVIISKVCRKAYGYEKEKKASEEIKRDMCLKPQKERSRGNKKGHVSGTSKKWASAQQ